MRPSWWIRAVVVAWLGGAAAEAAVAHGGIIRGGPGRTAGGGRPGRPGNPGKKKKGEETPPPDSGGGPESPPGDEGQPPPTTPPSEPPDTPSTPPSSPPTAPPSGPATPGLPAPVTGPVGPVTGGAPPAAPPATPRTGGHGSLARRATTRDDGWETWWNLTRELYLGRHGFANAAPTTRAAPFAGGAAASIVVGSSSGLLADDVRKSLLPLLALALRDESVEVADSAAIALGRSLSAKEVAPLLPHLARNLAHDESSPQEAAILALGMCGGPDAVALLRSIALDTPEGRKTCGATGPLADLQRGLATLALGIAGSQDALSPIVTLATSATVSRELAATAVVAMGLQREAAPAAIVTLSRLLDERGLDRVVRAQVPIAMARLPASAARGMLPKLVATLADKKTPDEVARSVALALGGMATLEDGEAARTLMEAARRHDDAATRTFSLIALGRIGERADEGVARDPASDSSLRDSIHAFLLDQVARPERKTQQPWSALALGLAARGDAGSPQSDARVAAAGARLLATFEEARDPSLQGATATALALMRCRAAAPELRARLQASSHPQLRGQLAVALGMLDDHEAIAPLRALISDPALPPTQRVDVARGLALLGDAAFEKQLIGLLGDAPDSMSAMAYAKALGLVGGRDAAPALRAMAEDRTRPEIQRGFAVVALGLLAEKRALPWNVPYLVDSNFTVELRPLDAISDIL